MEVGQTGDHTASAAKLANGAKKPELEVVPILRQNTKEKDAMGLGKKLRAVMVKNLKITTCIYTMRIILAYILMCNIKKEFHNYLSSYTLSMPLES